MLLPELTTWQWAGAAVAAGLVGLSKAGFGAGAGLLAVPLMTAVLGPANMLPVMLLVLITGDVFSVVHYLKKHDARNLAILIPGLLLGVWFGYNALGWFQALPDGELWLGRVIGFLAVALVGIQFLRFRRERSNPDGITAYRPRAWHGVGLGTAAGFTSTLAHAGGPLVLLYLLPQKLEKEVFVGTIIKYFFVGNVVKLIPYFQRGLFTMPRAVLAGALLPAVVVGTLVGVFMNRRFSDRTFRAVVYVLAAGVGVYLLIGWKPGVADEGAADAEPVSFRQALAAYDRGDYEAAAAAFEAIAAGGGRRQASARFNSALALYAAGRYEQSEAAFRRAESEARGLTAVRARFNSANCVYRRGRYGDAARLYAAVARDCARQLAGARGRNAALLSEVLGSARFNEALARMHAAGGGAEIERAERTESSPSAGEPDGRGGAEQAGAGVPGESRGPGGESAQAAGDEPVESVLQGLQTRDSGPVLSGERETEATAGPDW
ncbi:MAG: TSUP family transporter [Candidatus Brocadiia bacterium]